MKNEWKFGKLSYKYTNIKLDVYVREQEQNMRKISEKKYYHEI